MGKLVSFLIPSINKPAFVKTIECLKNTCSNIDVVEILTKIDMESDIPFYEDILQKSGFDYKILCSPVSGYTNIGVFHNEMAAVSQGDLVFIFGDDLFVQYGDWIKELENTRTLFRDNIYAVTLSCGESPKWFSLCVGVTKEWLQCLGYMTLGYQPDYWIALVARDIGRYIHISREKCHINITITPPHITKATQKNNHAKMFTELPNAVKKLKSIQIR